MSTLFVDEGRFVKRWAWSSTDSAADISLFHVHHSLTDLWPDQVRCVQIRRTQRALDAAIVDLGSVDTDIPGFLALKGRKLNDGQRVWGRVKRLSRPDKGPALAFVQPAPNTAPVGSLHPDTPPAFAPPFENAERIVLRRTEQTVPPAFGHRVAVSAEAFDDWPETSDTVPFGNDRSLIIEVGQTLTAIDVNAGTKLNVNLDAAPVIAREIWRQNLCGLIVIDFLRPDSKAQRAEATAVMQAAYDAIEATLPDALPRPRTEISPMDHRGLIIIERERIGASAPDLAVQHRDLIALSEMLESAWTTRTPMLGQVLAVSPWAFAWLEKRKAHWQDFLEVEADPSQDQFTCRWSNDER